jgi:type VI secretion system secreted protein VgrG
MPSPKSGTPCTLVPPTAPEVAKDADNADPGEVEKAKAAERQSKTGKYGKQQVDKYHKPNDTSAASSAGGGGQNQEEQKKKSWIAIKLKDTDGDPVPGEPYKVTLPDGSVATGSTDANGEAKITGFDPGSCKVEWPNLDKTVVSSK